MSFVPVNGQLAAASGTLAAAAGNPRRLNVALYNTSASTTETVALSITPGGGTARQLAQIVLSPNETALVEGVYLAPSDVFSGSSTNATTTNYHLTPSSEAAPFRISAFSSTGAPKSSATATGAASTYVNESNTAIATVGAGTLTAAAIVGGVITRSGSTAAYTDTTGTAADIIAARPSSSVGQSWEVTIKNTVAFTQTLAGGTGVTLSGTTVIPGLSVGRFLVTQSSASTVTMVGLAVLPLANLPAAKFTTTAGASPMVAAAGDLTGADFTVFQVTTNGAFGLTTRTAAEMFADIPNCSIGMSYLLRVVSQGDNTVTITGGSNVTITGTATVATKTTRDFVVTFTSATAATMQGVSKGTIE